MEITELMGYFQSYFKNTGKGENKLNHSNDIVIRM